MNGIVLCLFLICDLCRSPKSISQNFNSIIWFSSSGDKDDDDDEDADDKMQSSVLTGGEEGRQESQEQNEVDHGDFEMVVRKDHLLLRVFWVFFKH